MDDVIVDVMPVEEDILDLSNRWYPAALQAAEAHVLPSGTKIRLVTAPYVLATKIEAFHGRGAGDYLMSHDLGDVVALVDGRAELVDEIRVGPKALQVYLATSVSRWLADSDFVHLAVPGHLPYEGSRAPVVLRRLGEMAAV